jgi:hypothetical protein
MPFSVDSLLIAFVVTLFLLSGFYAIGATLSVALGQRRLYTGWQATFLYLFSGVFLSVSIYAIFRTSGMTVLLPVPFLLLFVVRHFNRKLTVEQSGNRWKPFLFLIAAVIVYVLCYAAKFIPREGQIAFTSTDELFYKNLSYVLRITGRENPMKEFLFPERFSVTPYHYGDLWLSALLSDLGIPESLKFMVLDAALKAMLGVGCIAYAQKLLQKTKLSGWLWMGLSIGFFSAFTIFYPSFILDWNVYSHELYQKLLLHSLCLIGIFFLFDEANKVPFLCLVYITGLVYIPVLPGLALATVLWIYLDYFFLSKKSVPNPTRSLLLVSLPVAIYCIVLYKVVPAYLQTGNNILAHTQVHYTVKDFLVAIKILVAGTLQLCVYIPLILLVVIDYRIQRRNGLESPLIKPALFFLVSFVSGLLAWAVTDRITAEALQLYQVLVVPLGIVLGLAIVIYIATRERRLLVKGLAVTMVIAAVVINRDPPGHIRQMDNSEYSRMSAFVLRFNLQKPLFANLNDTGYLQTNYWYANTVVYQPLEAIAKEVHPYLNFSLNAPYLHFDQSDPAFDGKKSMAEWAPFTYYVQKHQLQHLPPGQAMSRFMTQYKIDFLTVPDSLSIPEQLRASFTDSLTLPKTRWTIYKCSYK